MCRFRRWMMALVVSAAVPCAASAGPLDLFSPKENSPDAGQQSGRQANAKSRNQYVAEQIAKELKAAHLQGYNIQIEYTNGVARLNGQITDAQQKALASKMAARVRGVTRVENQLTLVSNNDGQSNKAQDSSRPSLFKKPQLGFLLSKKSASQAASRADQAGSGRQQTSPAPQDRLHSIRQVAATRTPPKLLPPSTAAPEVVANPSTLRRASKSKPNNQQVADEIAHSLRSAKLSGFDIGVRVENGVATLSGTVADSGQRARAEQVVAQVSGVDRVNNELHFSAAAAQPRTLGQPQLQRVAARPKPYPVAVPVANRSMPPHWQMAQAGQPPMPPMGGAGQPPMGPNGPGIPPSYGPGPAAPGISAPPSYGHPGQGASHTAYNMPQLPNYAWPAYAAYPNSAQVSYPTEYSASAWPYIGPFYPYPQIPLGWRKVQLEWDDGYWNLNFNPRTDKWFWFVNPKYW